MLTLALCNNRLALNQSMRQVIVHSYVADCSGHDLRVTSATKNCLGFTPNVSGKTRVFYVSVGSRSFIQAYSIFGLLIFSVIFHHGFCLRIKLS